MVKCTHTEAIFKNYQAPKQIEYIKQEHHEVRNKEIVEKIIDFFKRNSSARDYTVLRQHEQTQYQQPSQTQIQTQTHIANPQIQIQIQQQSQPQNIQSQSYQQPIR